MAVFFMASGFVYRDSTSDNLSSVWKGIKKRVKGLWLPFVIANFIFVLLHNYFIKINVYTDNPLIFDYVTGKHMELSSFYSLREQIKYILKGAFFSSNEILLGAGWFLKILFMTSVIYLIVDYFIKRITKEDVTKLILQGVLSFVLLIVGYYCSKHDISIKGFELVSSVYGLYFLGLLIRRIMNLYDFNELKYIYILFFSSLVILIYINSICTMELGINKYETPIHLVIASISGWILLFSLSQIICKYRCAKVFFSTLGKNTLSIVLLHFLSMKFAAIIIIAVYDLPEYCLAAHPNLYGNYSGWWALYTFLGCIIPCWLSLSFKYLKRNMD